MYIRVRHALAFAAVALAATGSLAQTPLGTGFTYQGQLKTSGNPADGIYDFTFRLFDAATAGNQIGGIDTIDDVSVTDGLFTVTLNSANEFGAAAFTGQARWLNIAVKRNSDFIYTTLSPRQPLTAAPFAFYALSGPGSGGAWAVNSDDIYNTNTGSVGIGTSTPNASAKLHVVGTVRVDGGVTSDGGYFVYDNNNPSPLINAHNDGTGQAGIFTARQGDAVEARSWGSGTAVSGYCNSTGRAGSFEIDNVSNSAPAIYAEHNGTGAAVSASNIGTGHAGVFIATGANSSAYALYCLRTGTGTGFYSQANGTARAGHFRNTNAGSGADALLCENLGTGFGLRAVTSGNPFSAGVMGVGTAADSSGVIGEANNGTQAYGVWGRAAQGIGGVFEGGTYALVANGTARVNVLEIVGADVAEKFPTSEELKPGMVAAIDRQNPGKLCLARGAYNRCVAGVVSGAGDLPVGAVLGNLPASESGPPIALSGRVWVYCDATNQGIEPGDPLTASDTPGHAMSVSDFARAQGAVIGKAMTTLSLGEKGLVLVLVNLQ